MNLNSVKMNKYIALILVLCSTMCLGQSGKLPVNKLPVNARSYLQSNNHKIKGAAYICENKDTMYYVNSRKGNLNYATSYNSKGDLESIDTHKDNVLVGIIIIFLIVILV